MTGLLQVKILSKSRSERPCGWSVMGCNLNRSTTLTKRIFRLRNFSRSIALAAVAILREKFRNLKIRFVNVVDLFKLQPITDHPHGLSDRDFDSIFTCSKPVIFNFHGYPWLIHKLAYKRANHDNLHVRGYKEVGSINTPLQLATHNQT